MTLAPLHERRAVVTGAAHDIGKHIALALAEAGADVAVSDRDKNSLDDVVMLVNDRGTLGVALPADLADTRAGARLVADAVAALGGIDIVVNNTTHGTGDFDILALGDWRRALRIDLEAVAEVCVAAGPHLRKRRRGAVVNVTSTAALTGCPTAPHYAAAEAAVISLTRSLALHWAPANIRVNALCAGSTTGTPPQGEDEYAACDHVPLGRHANPSEIASPAVFLTSDAASYMTGQVLVVDGGRLVG